MPGAGKPGRWVDRHEIHVELKLLKHLVGPPHTWSNSLHLIGASWRTPCMWKGSSSVEFGLCLLSARYNKPWEMEIMKNET